MNEPGEIPQTESTSTTTFEKEIPLQNGESIKLLSLHVGKMTLYHGTPVPDITSFEEGDQQTTGRGVYFTPTREAAKGYARKRGNNDNSATVYEAQIYDLDIADLRTREAQEQFARLFRQSFVDWERDTLPNLKGPAEDVLETIKKQRGQAVRDLIGKIDTNSFNQLRDLTFGWGDLVSRTLLANGYKGLISIEGEPPSIPLHDSVVIFDPQDLNLTRKEKIVK